MILDILIGDAPTLRQKSERVKRTDDLGNLLDDMLATMEDAGGVGLAAPQVGFSKRVLIARLPVSKSRFDEREAGVLCEMINPVILASSQETMVSHEACLSLPGYAGMVSRPVNIRVEYRDRDFKRKKLWITNPALARIIQHEIDHLNGKLFVDRAEETWQIDEKEKVQSE